MLLLIYILFLLAAATIGGLLAWTRIRRARVRVVVQTLASIVGQNLPLVPALQAAASAERSALRRTYTRIATRLGVGDALSTALRTSMLSCPGDIIGAIIAAEQGGTLPSVLRSLAAEARRNAHARTTRHPATLYTLVLVLVVPLIFLFIATVTLPRFKEIFQDFDTAMPAITLTLFGIADVVSAYGWLYFLLFISAACC